MKKLCHAVLILILTLALALTGCGGGSGGGSGGGGNPGGGNGGGVTFQSATQIGGASGTADSTGLTLTFSADPTTLTADNISVTGATKGALSGTGTTRTLAIYNINIANEATVTVTITNPAITGSPQTAAVFRVTQANMSIGMEYRGGKIAYILQDGEPGYDANVPHGLIAATEDQSEGIIWAIEAYKETVVGGTSTDYGTGSANTDHIIAQNGAGSTYAAGLARAYNGGGYSDWYLPSKEELNKLYLNQDAIGNFTVFEYWSSSEYNQWYAWFQRLSNGEQVQADKDWNYLKVRAVRSF